MRLIAHSTAISIVIATFKTNHKFATSLVRDIRYAELGEPTKIGAENFGRLMRDLIDGEVLVASQDAYSEGYRDGRDAEYDFHFSREK